MGRTRVAELGYYIFLFEGQGQEVPQEGRRRGLVGRAGLVRPRAAAPGEEGRGPQGQGPEELPAQTRAALGAVRLRRAGRRAGEVAAPTPIFVPSPNALLPYVSAVPLC